MDSAQGHQNSLSESSVLYHPASLLNEEYFSYVELLRIHMLRHRAKNNGLAFPDVGTCPVTSTAQTNIEHWSCWWKQGIVPPT